MSAPDFRALCAELADELHAYKIANAQHDDSLVTRTRAALAAKQQKPTEAEVQALFDQMRRPIYAQTQPFCPPVEVGREPVGPYDFALAVLHRWGNQ